eukprot:8315167-Pyramimonas_sp.AAC.1
MADPQQWCARRADELVPSRDDQVITLANQEEWMGRVKICEQRVSQRREDHERRIGQKKGKDSAGQQWTRGKFN